MKVRVLHCAKCGEDKMFVDSTEEYVNEKIKESGWVNFPDKNGSSTARCPDCEKKTND